MITYGTTADGQASRPYADGSAAPSPGRNAAFSTGQVGDPASAASSLNQDALHWNSIRAYRPLSVLTPVGTNPGGLGMSQGDAARRWADGSYMGSINATSVSSFEPSALLHATGLNAE